MKGQFVITAMLLLLNFTPSSSNSIPSASFFHRSRSPTLPQHRQASAQSLLKQPWRSLKKSHHRQAFVTLRGGAAADSDDDENDSLDNDQEEEDDDDLDDDDEDNESSVSLSDTPTILQQFRSFYEKTPPVTKLYLTSSFLLTAASSILNQGQPFQSLTFSFPKLFSFPLPQLWRLITPFLDIGQFGIGYLLTLNFIHQYSSTLEKSFHASPLDFLLLLTFGMSTMLTFYTIFNIDTSLIGHNFSTYLVYIWSKNHEGMSVSIMDVLTVPAELLPYFFLMQTVVLEGTMPTLDLLGIAFGHLYCYYVNEKKRFKVPDRFVDVYERLEGWPFDAIKAEYKKIGEEFEV